MEDNVALDSSKQKKFIKSITGIKKLINKNEQAETKKPLTPSKQDGKITKKWRKPKGLVYLSHIPHGFYEHEMTQYFRQFGVVTNARVIRSKRTGNSKGHAFVEFREPAVAEIVAETMNNYLMGKRLIKAAYIPPEKQKKGAKRKHWNSLHNPGRDLKIKMKKAYNENKDDKANLKKARKTLASLAKTKQKLSEFGINYDFFTPVDIPEALLENIKTDIAPKDDVKQEENKSSKKNKKQEVKAEGDNKKRKGPLKAEAIKVENVKENNDKKSKGKNDIVPEVTTKKAKQEPATVQKSKKESVVVVPKKEQKEKEKKTKEVVVSKKEQKEKEKKLKESGVIKPMEDFISIAQDSDDSDSSFEFDSDEYEKMIEQDDNSLGDSDDQDDSDANDDEGSLDEDDDEEDEEESEEETPPAKKQKGKPVKPVPPKVQPQAKQLVNPIQKKQKIQQEKKMAPQEIKKAPQKIKKAPQEIKKVPQEMKKVPQEMKKVPQEMKKAPAKAPVPSKKPNFEKQTQKPMKKHFKKKK